MTYSVSKKLYKSDHYIMSKSSMTYFEFASNYMCSYKTKSKIQFIAVLWGQIDYSINDESVTQNNAELFLIPFFSDLNIHVIKPTKLMVIEINDDLVKSIYSKLPSAISFNNAINNPKPYLSIKYDSALFRIIQNIHNEYSENSNDPYLVELNIHRLIYTLLKTEYAGYLFSIQAQHPMEQVKYYIHRNIKRNIKINDLAKMTGMNSSNFTNTFKRNFGMTPMQYIADLKMNLAAQMLREYSVTDAALELGYENVSPFISQFKKIHNITPKQYQISKL